MTREEAFVATDRHRPDRIPSSDHGQSRVSQFILRVAENQRLAALSRKGTHSLALRKRLGGEQSQDVLFGELVARARQSYDHALQVWQERWIGYGLPGPAH